MSVLVKNRYTIQARIKWVASKTLLFKEVVGPYNSREIGNEWVRLWRMFRNSEFYNPFSESIGIMLDDPKETLPQCCRYHACISLSTPIEPPIGYQLQRIEAGKYAIFRHKGPHDEMGYLYEEVFTTWAEQSGEFFRPAAQYEVYLNAPINTASEELLTDVFIPIL